MPIRISKTNMYVAEGPPSGSILVSKTNMYVAEGPPVGNILITKTNMYVAQSGVPEGPADEVRVYQASFIAGLSGGTGALRAAKVNVASVTLNFDEAIQATQVNYSIPVVEEQTLVATKANYQVVCLGRRELPRVLAWTATLDGHDYYFLQLSDLTLVYDFHSEQWYNWGSSSAELWRAQIGVDWNANLAYIIGSGEAIGASSILVGDYISGALYFLDTNMAEDENYASPGTRTGFQRLAYGQLAMRGINHVACNGVQIAGSIGENVTASDMSVTLSYSDDQGHTFYECDAITLVNSEYEMNLHWRSLGSFRGPGRIFKIEDWGALNRIDGMDMDDGE